MRTFDRILGVVVAIIGLLGCIVVAGLIAQNWR